MEKKNIIIKGFCSFLNRKGFLSCSGTQILLILMTTTSLTLFPIFTALCQCQMMRHFFHGHLRVAGLQGKEESISLNPHHHFHLLHRHSNINQAIIASDWTRAGNLWFPSASPYQISYAPFQKEKINKYIYVSFYLI